jgi:signal transduction histidine kinase
MPTLVVALALGILGGAVLAGHRHLRRVVRDQLVNGDGELLYKVAQALPLDFHGTNLDEELKGQAMEVALRISPLSTNTLGVRLFDAAGRFVTAVPPYLTEATLDAETFAGLQALRPVSRFHRQVVLSDYFLMLPSPGGAGSNTLPLLEVNIPINAPGGQRLLASVQLLMEGTKLAAKLAELDLHLALEGLAVFACGGALLTAALVWAYLRLERANALLGERTQRLLRANHELTLAAKTTALGAVTAHLIHGLSNPLACLQIFMSIHGEDHPEDSDWQGAVAATNRMRGLVQEVVRVLGEQEARESYEITLEELAQALESKLRPLAQNLGVNWRLELSAQGRLSNDRANVILLILENLVCNALQVTPGGKTVRTSFRAAAPRVVCEVADEGPGFPESAMKSLFVPCRSTKGGSGLGLAISKQLADHLEAGLELRHNGPGGCVMALLLPPSVFASAAAETSELRFSSGGQ